MLHKAMSALFTQIASEEIKSEQTLPRINDILKRIRSMQLYNKFKVVFSFYFIFFYFCIELEEHIIINNDRSGSYAILLDLGIISNNLLHPKYSWWIRNLDTNAINGIDGISDVKLFQPKANMEFLLNLKSQSF